MARSSDVDVVLERLVVRLSSSNLGITPLGREVGHTSHTSHMTHRAAGAVPAGSRQAGGGAKSSAIYPFPIG